jgi:cytochrome c553
MGPALRISLLALGISVFANADDFTTSIRPVLAQNCSACHNPANPKNRINFLKATSSADMESNRALWRDVAAQMRNRTMPPVETKLTEDDRLRVANWIDNRLRETACYIGDYAGAVALRRLNRREFHNTIRDLLGVEFNVSELFPADGTGGAGFDTNGETLFIPPLMMERYLEAAQQILDRAIVTPPLRKTWTGTDNVLTSVYLDGEYDILVTLPTSDNKPKLTLSVDGGSPVALTPRAVRGRGGRGAQAPTYAVPVHLARGLRNLVVSAEVVSTGAAALTTLTIQQKSADPAPERLALHYRLLGTEPGSEPLRPRVAAEQILRSFLRKAWRRPVENTDVTPLLTLYDRAAERGDPFEERMKLALKAVLVGPDFLFKMEHRSDKPGIYPLGQYELATRLSYFLWSTMPDEELSSLAAQGKLQEPAVLRAQVDRMLDDPKSRAFSSTFIGQWLGTQDLGGRAAPMLTELQAYYTPPVAADLRAEPILLFERILGENRSLLELLTADYTYMTDNLVKFYQFEDKFKDFHSEKPKLVQWPDNRRAGVINSGAVMAMTSHYRQTSPVLRGAWVLETILGTPVPPPPPNVPALEAVKCLDNCVVTAKTAVGMRGRILAHRVNPACSACHNLMDPIGFAMENFDWTGRWRDKEFDDSPIDATGTLPSGEKFDGPLELRKVLLNKKDEFLRHFTGKVLAYALGRSLQDGDSCTVQHLADALRKDNYQARTLIREIVLSTPFRNSQGGKVTITTAAPPPQKVQRPMVVK